MKNSNYWKKRMKELEKARYAKSQEYYQKLEEEFKKAENQISKDIEVWYARLAENNEISLAEARKFLSESELEEFKWTVNEYIKHGKANTNGQWDKQLENASAKVHISRLEAIQTQIQHHCEVLYSSMAAGLTEHLADIYENTYYRTAFAIEQGFEVGTTLHALDDRRIQTAMEHCWALDGKTFSDRIWQNKEKLTRELNTMLMQSVIQGKNAGDYIGELAKKMNVSRRNASMLIMTESAAIASEATQGCYKDLGVKEFEFVATLDDHTSEICQSMDGQHFPISEYNIGVNAPPLHPWCRSTTVPYFDDDFTAMEKRAARDENGNTYYVPADMTYKEWKDKFVAKDAGNGTIKLTDEEQYALNQYLSFESYGINDKLRNGIQLSNMEKTMVSNLDSALKKMPHYEGDLSRSLYFGDTQKTREFMRRFTVDKKVKFDEYISATCSKDLYNPDGEVQIYIQNVAKAHDVSKFNSSEMEILYERGSEFKVMNVMRQEGKYWVLLEEC